MTIGPPPNYTRLAAAIVIAGVGIGASIVVSSYVGTTMTVTRTATLTQTTTTITTTTVTSLSQTATSVAESRSLCISPGQPGGAFLRVLDDSTSLPVVGAKVTAVERAYSSDCGIATASAFDFQATYTFLTNNTEWYPLNTLDAESYSFTIAYSGHIYEFVAQLGPVINICATLYLLSGMTSVTSSGLNSCASGSPG